MGYPSVVELSFGDEKVSQSTKIGGLPLGIRGILPDGREFVHAKAAATLGIGTHVVQKAVAGTSVNVVAGASAAIGATTVVLTMPATTLITVANQYADGYLATNDATGEGYTYKIKTSNTAAASGTATFTLEPNDAIKVALVSGTSECTIRENEFYNVLARAAGTTAVGIPAGVPQVPVSADYYCWLQRRGPATLLAGGTLMTTGRPFAACTVEASFQAWVAAPADTTTAPVSEPLGYCMVAPAASTEYFLGYLQLD